MESSIVKRSRILCWHILYIAVEENTTKTVIKNGVFAFFTKEVKGCFGNLAQLYTCGRQMPAERVGPVKCICCGEENAGHFREIDREWGDIFRVAKAICVCYNMHQMRM